MWFFIPLLAFATGLARAIVPPLPSPTDPLVDTLDLFGFTPKPTDAADFPFELRRRSSVTSGQFLGWFAPDNTCGYVDGSIGGYKTCSETQICAALEFQNLGTMGCCDTADAACTWYGTCIDYVGYWSSSLCDQACQNDINTVQCTDSDYPYCYSFSIPGISVEWYSCAATDYSKFVEFDTTFSGETDGRTWSKVYYTGGSTSALATFGSGPSSNPSLPSSSSSSSSTIIQPIPTPTQTSKPAPVGAIVGGVVGGLAVVGVAAAGIVFLLLRRRKTNNAGPAVGAAATGTAPEQGPAPNMTQQQATQSTYGAPVGYQPQQDPSMAGYFAGGKQDYSPNTQQGAFDAAGGIGVAKFGGPPVSQQEIQPPTSPAPPYSHPVPQQNTGVSALGGPPPNVQELSIQPMGGVQSLGGPPPGMGVASTGGPPPGMGVMSTGGPPPGMGMMSTGGPPPGMGVMSTGGPPPGMGVASTGGPPQMMQQSVAQELPTQYATPMHTAQGEPIYEAPDQTYRSV